VDRYAVFQGTLCVNNRSKTQHVTFIKLTTHVIRQELCQSEKTRLSVSGITLSVKAARGIQAVRDVIGSLKAIFAQVSQNATLLETVWLAEPLIKQVPACCVAKYNSVAYRNSIFTIVSYISSISDKGWFYQCPCRIGDIIARHFEGVDDGSTL